MITITKEAYSINGDNPGIQLPEVPEGKYDVVIILQPVEPLSVKRKAGFSQTKFVMDDDFNAPLEDLKEYM